MNKRSVNKCLLSFCLLLGVVPLGADPLLFNAAPSGAKHSSEQVLSSVAQAQGQYKTNFIPPNPTNFLSSYLNNQLPAWGGTGSNAGASDAGLNTRNANTGNAGTLPTAGTSTPAATGNGAYNWVQ